MTPKTPAKSRRKAGTPKKPAKSPLKTSKPKTTKSGKPSKAGQMNGKRGRPTGYTPPLGRAICKMIAAGMSLREVCARPRIKARCSDWTVRSWAINPTHEFSSQYMRARDVSYHRMADDIIEIADDSRNDYVERKNNSGETVIAFDAEAVRRSHLRLEARKWLLSKALPKLYGDKLHTELTGPNGGPLQTQDVNPQATGEDHLAHLGRRYGGAQKLKVIDGGKVSKLA